MEIKLFINKLFEEANKLKLTDFEIYFVSSNSQSIKIFKGEVDNFSDSQNMGISFRVKLNDKMGYSYTESLEDSDILPLINSAIENSKIIECDDIIDIYSEKKEYKKLNLYNESLENVSVEDKINFLLTAEKTAFNMDPRVKNVNYCVLGSGSSDIIIKNSKGLDLSNKSNSIYAYMAVVVQENDIIKNASAYIVTDDFSEMDPIALAKEAVEKAIIKLNPIELKSNNYKIIIENDTFADLLGAMSGIFSAEAVQKGVSKFKGKLNEVVANNIVTIIDDPHLDKGYGSASFDAEGVPTIRKNLIENGILKTFIHNLKTAKKDGISSTGNAAKGGYKGTMGVSTFNLFLEKGEKSLDDLIKNIKSGILITGFSGLHSGLNSISGDFSLATEGLFIENGKIVAPLNQFTTAGNFFDVLKNIEEIGSDLKFNLSAVGSPSVVINNLSISS